MIPIDESVFFDVVTSHPSTGAVTDADATPTFDVYEESTDTGLLGATNLTKRTSLTGNYRGSFTASAANGFEAGKWYSVIASATVNAIAGKVVAKNFRIAPAESSAGVPKTDPSHWGGTAVASANVLIDGGITAAKLAADAITAAKVAADVTTELQAGLATAAAVSSVDAKLPAALVSGRIDSHVGSIADAVLTAAKFAAGAFDAVWAVASRLLTAGTNIVLAKGVGVTGFNDLSAAQVNTEADAALADAGLVASLAAVDARIPVSLVAGRMDSSVGAMAANVLTASSLAADAVDEILDEAIGDGTLTMRQALRVLIAGMAGKLSGAATTTITIRNVADSADVILATVDASGNRTATTVTP